MRLHLTAPSELALDCYRDPGSMAGKTGTLLRHGFGDHPLHKKSGQEPAPSQA